MDGCSSSSGGPALEHLPEPLEGVELLQLELAVDAADEDVGDVVDLILEAEVGAVAALPLPGVAHHVDHGPRRAHQFVVLVREQRVRQVVVVVDVVRFRRLLVIRRREAVARRRGHRVEHDGLLVVVVARAGVAVVLLVVAIDVTLLLVAYDGVDLGVDGGHEELLVAEDADDEEPRLERAGLGPHHRRLGLHHRHDRRHHLLQERRRLRLHRLRSLGLLAYCKLATDYVRIEGHTQALEYIARCMYVIGCLDTHGVWPVGWHGFNLYG
jgi:hypothetical protein